MWAATISAIIIWAWFFCGLAAHGWSPNNASKWSHKQWQYFRSPEGHTTLAIFAIGVGLLIFGLVGVLSEQAQWWEDLATEAIGLGGTVVILDVLNLRRTRLEYKRSIVRQMASLSNDFALDAARIARDEGWLVDGSLKRQSFKGANLQDAVLWDADFEGADFLGAKLNKAYLNNANLRRAHLTCFLEDAKLMSANLEDANLSCAQLERAKLTNACLKYANLANAYLEKVDLTGTDLSYANLQGAKYDSWTRWPQGFDPKAAGAVLVNELRASLGEINRVNLISD